MKIKMLAGLLVVGLSMLGVGYADNEVQEMKINLDIAPPNAQELTETSIIFFDMTFVNGYNLNNTAQRRLYYDQTHLVSSLQGIVNRECPRLYVRYNQQLDDFWWQRMTESGEWLAEATVVQATSIEHLLDLFAPVYEGAVVWDERVPATSNLASTIAGCDQLLCLRYDDTPGSLYHHLVTDTARLEVIRDLRAEDGAPLFTGSGVIPDTTRASSGSAKNDAYLWLLEHYVKHGKTNPRRLGYYLDGYWLQSWTSAGGNNHTLNNHDYVIAQQGVIFDLHVWEDEAPVDDPGQIPGTDLETLKEFLLTCYEHLDGNAMIHVAGFVPWAYKYTSHHQAGGQHDPVATEWRYAEILSCYNAYMDADAIGLSSMVNASFFQHYPLDEHYPQDPGTDRESLIARGVLDASGYLKPKRYIAHYVGDYDAAAWLYQSLPVAWMDSVRGELPLSWAFNPNLCERFPFGMAWTRKTRTPNDFFVAGDSGAGYVNPGHLVPPREFSGLPSGLDVWEAHCQAFYDQWDLTVTGYVIDGSGPEMTDEVLDAYARFSLGGIVRHRGQGHGLYGNMPWIYMGTMLPHDLNEATNRIVHFMRGAQQVQFFVCRSILRTPSYYAYISQNLPQRMADTPEVPDNAEVVVVDIATLLWLIREYESNLEFYRCRLHGYCDADEVLATPAIQDGLWALWWGDGQFGFGQASGEDVWIISSVPGENYMYFAVSDGFFYHSGMTVDVEVTYYDDASGSLALEYDGLSNAYEQGQEFQRTGTGGWKTAIWRLPNARFINAQNGSTDFRLRNGGSSLMVSQVKVTKVQPTPTRTPSMTPTTAPTMTPTPTAQVPTDTPTPLPTATPTFCMGDADRNGFINSMDYRSVCDYFGMQRCGVGDANGDCFVNSADYRSVRDHFGQSCS